MEYFFGMNFRDLARRCIRARVMLILIIFTSAIPLEITYVLMVSSNPVHKSMGTVTESSAERYVLPTPSSEQYRHPSTSRYLSYGSCRNVTLLQNEDITLEVTVNMTKQEFLEAYTTYCCSVYLPHRTDLPPCDCVPAGLKGRVNVSFSKTDFLELQSMFPEVTSGGTWCPRECAPRHTVAVIIPYRDRQSHLAILLRRLHSMLQRQLLNYTIIVSEQNKPDTFNKAALMNAGYLQARQLANFDCYIFHDVDVLPEDDHNFYTCAHTPRHVGAFLSKFNYTLRYHRIFGAATAFTSKQFETVKGFSNVFYGWGGEDDDMSARVLHNHYSILRYPRRIARYVMIQHSRDPGNPYNRNSSMLVNRKSFKGRTRKGEGLSTLQYHVVSLTSQPMYTHVLVDLPQNKNLQLTNKWPKWKIKLDHLNDTDS